MIEVPRSSTREMPRLSWDWTGPHVTIRCPNGHFALLDHEIADDGTVSPSVVCPWDGCGFHEFIRLLDWPATRRDRRQ